MGSVPRLRDAMRYGFAVGRVRVLESRLLDPATLERLLDAPDFAEQVLILSDTPYGGVLEDASTVAEVEARLRESLDSLYADFCGRANLPRSVRDFFALPRQLAELRMRALAQLRRHDAGDSASEETAAAEIRTTALAALPGADVPHVPSVTARDVEHWIDRISFAETLRRSEATGERLLLELARTRIDLANVKAIVRARHLGWSASEARERVLPGGTLTQARLLDPYGLPPAELAAALVALPPLSAGEISGPAELDIIADEVVLRALRGMLRMPTGAQPIIGYVLAREAEVVTLRLLLLGRLSGLPSELLRSRLREAG